MITLMPNYARTEQQDLDNGKSDEILVSDIKIKYVV
jgi:hypothetical protein